MVKVLRERMEEEEVCLKTSVSEIRSGIFKNSCRKDRKTEKKSEGKDGIEKKVSKDLDKLHK